MNSLFPGNWSLHMRSDELQLCFNPEFDLHFDNFPEFAAHLTTSLNLKLVQQDMAADSYCWVINDADKHLLLNYQEMSQSCWFCVTREDDEAVLLSLANRLIAK
ncbi:DUF3630 family protein [Motilimonas sp. 1_MG-2023]|uniref:DUF3630 family protein n=1 Tax=Motilimonas sp. 1_MG-2023 TaxID=3062672 RepID=UPI0026E360A0|nr:DUF3630 family protein [Motilimonas sp. 1_MG-2023]MDO6525196.1 DUF3630 family protein [Motilimonas sp. 1_MG-2023]